MKYQKLSLSMLFPIALLFNKIGCPPPKGFRCAANNRLGWRDIPPYTFHDNSTLGLGGLVLDIFDKGMHRCCLEHATYTHTATMRSLKDAADLIANATNSGLEFMMPIQREAEGKKFLGHPYVPLVVSPGFALFRRPHSNAIVILFSAIHEVVPILIITFIVVCIAGTVYWLIENFTLAATGREPERFNPGVFSAIWWAFVTMSTVGYGDVVPKTKPGRIFNVMWVFAGVSLTAMTVSGITESLVSALTQKKVELRGSKVAVLRASGEYRYAFSKQATAIEFDSIEEIEKALRRNAADLALIDVLIASQFERELQHFNLVRIVEVLTSYGVVFLPPTFKLSNCIRQYTIEEQMDILEHVSSTVKIVVWPSNKIPSTLMDPSSIYFQYFMICIVGLLVLLHIIGVFGQWIKKRSANISGEIEEGSDARLVKSFDSSFPSTNEFDGDMDDEVFQGPKDKLMEALREKFNDELKALLRELIDASQWPSPSHSRDKKDMTHDRLILNKSSRSNIGGTRHPSERSQGNFF